MKTEVFVNKVTLINLLGGSALDFARFMTGDIADGKALKVLFENIDELDLNCDLVKGGIIPLLVGHGVLSQVDLDRVNAYIEQELR